MEKWPILDKNHRLTPLKKNLNFSPFSTSFFYWARSNNMVSGANMAATRILAPLLLLLCLHLEKPIMQESLPNFLLRVRKACCGDSGVRDDAVFLHGPCSCVRFVTRRSRHARLRYSVLVWHKHGLLTTASSEQDICLDICICMDVESNPGPDNRFECESHTTRLITYTKQDLLRLRTYACCCSETEDV